jgi:N-glycosylase/DNA lyase
VKLDEVPFNLDITLCCGQVFRWDKKGEWWYGVAKDKAVKIRQYNAEVEFVNADEKFIANYFGLDDDLQKIRDNICKDEHVRKALQEFWGLRIIRQNPWECLVSYICATYKSIAAIKHIILKLSKKFGKKITLDGYDFYTFPTPEKLAKTTESALMECGLGYRAKYVLETSKRIFESNFSLESLRKMPYRQAKKELTAFSGVGLKVADCILLFSLAKREAFPVDVWVKRAFLKHYAAHFPKAFIEKISSHKSLSNAEYEKLNEFGRTYFGKYAGYAQEYLYHYERVTPKTCFGSVSSQAARKKMSN